MLANKGSVIKATLKDLKKVFGGPKWKAQDYKELLALLFTILKLVRTKGMIALEQHIENPEQSPIFQQYPKIMHDHFAVEFICDTLRMITMSFEDPHQVEDMMDKQLEKHHHEIAAPQHAIQSMADGIPALGIVAAVLGVIKTMASISEPVEVLGGMIGGALVGTFLGVFLAYGFIGPMANKLGQIYDQDHLFYCIIRAVLVSHLQGNAPQVSVEIGRGNVPTLYQPSFQEMEQYLQNLPAVA
jgi:chemotaxis protein MotA